MEPNVTADNRLTKLRLSQPSCPSLKLLLNHLHQRLPLQQLQFQLLDD